MITLWIWEFDLELLFSSCYFFFTNKDKKYTILRLFSLKSYHIYAGFRWNHQRTIYWKFKLRSPCTAGEYVFANICLIVLFVQTVFNENWESSHTFYFSCGSRCRRNCTPSANRRTLSIWRQCANNGAQTWEFSEGTLSGCHQVSDTKPQAFSSKNIFCTNNQDRVSKGLETAVIFTKQRGIMYSPTCAFSFNATCLCIQLSNAYPCYWKTTHDTPKRRRHHTNNGPRTLRLQTF